MRTWGLMLSFIPFDWNSVFKCQYLGVAASEKVDKPSVFRWEMYGRILFT